MAKKKRHGIWLTAAACALAVGAVAAFLNAGSWLLVRDDLPPRIDVIMTFAGENARVVYSRQLMDRFPNAHWVLSDYFHTYSRMLARESYDLSRVTIVDTCSNTVAEVSALRDWLNDVRVQRDSSGWRPPADGRVHVAFVSSPYHMRRIQFMVRRLVRDQNIIAHYCPVPLEKYSWTAGDMKQWWRSPQLRQHVESEIGKLLFFLLMG